MKLTAASRGVFYKGFHKSSGDPFWDDEKVAAALRRVVSEALERH